MRSALAACQPEGASAHPDTAICMNDLAGVLLERRLKHAEQGAEVDLSEVEALSRSCLAALQTLGCAPEHAATIASQHNLAVVQQYRSGGDSSVRSGGGEAGAAPAATASPLAELQGEWLIDESVSQNTGALLTYFGAPWLLVQAVLASPTPPMHVQLGSDLLEVRVTYPGLFPLANVYRQGAPSFHKSPFGQQQPCTFTLGLDDAGAPALVIEIPQTRALGLMRITHAMAGARQRVVVRMILEGAEKIRITRIYDRRAPAGTKGK